MTNGDGKKTAIQPLLTTKEAAAILGVSPNTMNWWRAYRKGPTFYKVGHSARYRVDDLQLWLENQRVETPEGREAIA